MERSMATTDLKKNTDLKQIQIYGKAEANTDLWWYFGDLSDDPGDVDISQGAIFFWQKL